MLMQESPERHKTIDYGVLLLAHIICADQQIHSKEAQVLRDLALRSHSDKSTLQEMEKILGQADDCMTLEEAAQQVPVEQQTESLRQVLAVAYVDGYFSPIEKEIVNRIVQLWGINAHEIRQMLESAQGFSRWRTHSKSTINCDEDGLSIGARLLKGAESVLSKSLVNKLTELAPENIGEKIERLQREILLSGPEYDEAIKRCAKIAREDYFYADGSLRATFLALEDLGNGLQLAIRGIQEKTNRQGEHQTARDVALQLEQTRRNLLSEVLHDLENVREALRAKQRSLDYFTIAFLGRTKAGKSTLHAVITGEGWEAKGIGKQRTTRYNRVYEWKNIRIIDTPGIGAPGGKTDEEIASSVIEEADVICYVVTNDSIQESEFKFLELLKAKTKPLTVLLNIQYNLRDSRRLDHFLKAPDRWFTKEGKNGIGGHLNRISRYAQQHYNNDYLTIIPVMLLAAQLAQEPELNKRAKQLFKASRIQDFLDSLRVALIDYGPIRRSQTLLGSTVGAINEPQQWISQQATAYDALTNKIQEKHQDFVKQLEVARKDQVDRLQQKIREIFQTAFDRVDGFAEDHWDKNELEMQSGWKAVLNNLAYEKRINAANRFARQEYQQEVQTIIEEIGSGLQLIEQLQGTSFRFTKQDTGLFDKNFVKIASSALLALGAIATLFTSLPALVGFLPIGISLLANKFESKDQKRRKAVKKISEDLRRQLKDQQAEILQQSTKNFENYCSKVAASADKYFEELAQGIETIASQLTTAESRLTAASKNLNRAYAKRIVDWAAGRSEILVDQAINKSIRKVERDFGRSIKIRTTVALSLTKSQTEISRILQERVEIRPDNSNSEVF